MPNELAYSEFTEYPELTEAQKRVLQSIGLALFGVQGVEARLKFVVSFIFPEQEDATLQQLYSSDQKQSKDTLGRLIHKLHERAEVSPHFESQLSTFLRLRNRFVHGLLQEPDYSLGCEDGILRTQSYISDLEFHAWHIDAVLTGYMVLFTDALGIRNKVQQDDSTYFQNLHKYFSPELLFKSKA